MRPPLIFEDRIKEFLDSRKIVKESNRFIRIEKRLTDKEYRKLSRIFRKHGYRYVNFGDARGWMLDPYANPPIKIPSYWELTERGTIKHGLDFAMRDRFYFIEDGDCTWIVPVSGNPNAIYFHDPRHEEGFGGAVIPFIGNDGEIREFKGPWHSNAEGLYKRTGIDLRKKRICPFDYDDPAKQCPYYEEDSAFPCKKRLHPFDDPSGEDCIKRS